VIVRERRSSRIEANSRTLKQTNARECPGLFYKNNGITMECQ